ncbi:SGNH/GDSL hydrolase family protein [Rhodococcus fascians]|nr:SGNH/GDSL hydrolase family protein [Rhodococcus fascians]MBY4235582.1 SGNH/GDSL hydrolase family protein [Rhodococcus fascians]MBY4251273.1 SGNH/GDSL hydrolase family protein [Rhodococcus fascians]MBY4266928.1 SGNH/GDSL hydrolase family protein [Rhodococcus fascians]
MSKLSSRNQMIIALAVGVVTLLAVFGGLFWIDSRNDREVSSSAERPAAEIPPPVSEERVTLAVIGDSYSVPVQLADHWPTKLAYQHRWYLRNVAKGGVGYVQENVAKGKYSFLRQLDDIIPVKPAVLIVAGGRNDVSHPYEVGPAAREMFAKIKAELPDAKVLIVGPMVGADVPTPTAWNVNEEIRTAALEAGLPFVDGMAWLTNPDVLKEDRAHPNSAGNVILAEKIGAALEPLLPPAN